MNLMSGKCLVSQANCRPDSFDDVQWPQKIGQRYKWISGLIYAMLMATISGGNHAKKTAPESLTGI